MAHYAVNIKFLGQKEIKKLNNVFHYILYISI